MKPEMSIILILMVLVVELVRKQRNGWTTSKGIVQLLKYLKHDMESELHVTGYIIHACTFLMYIVVHT